MFEHADVSQPLILIRASPFDYFFEEYFFGPGVIFSSGGDQRPFAVEGSVVIILRNYFFSLIQISCFDIC